MAITTLSGREFNQDIARAKRAAETGPVIITDRGSPAYVLQRYDDWRHQTGARPGVSLLEALADPASVGIEFEPPRVDGPIGRAADLS
ncbi:MAG: type II toxin-antitoxin system prevent-host-death family antitoxin [Azospirillaceae bacterium]|nr:type II toxin-antitoxin system prevent-host-death family antitoxin [Azospirillaceae bacterium]